MTCSISYDLIIEIFCKVRAIALAIPSSSATLAVKYLLLVYTTNSAPPLNALTAENIPLATYFFWSISIIDPSVNTEI
jgi:hypothetical protein